MPAAALEAAANDYERQQWRPFLLSDPNSPADGTGSAMDDKGDEALAHRGVFGHYPAPSMSKSISVSWIFARMPGHLARSSMRRTDHGPGQQERRNRGKI